MNTLLKLKAAGLTEGTLKNVSYLLTRVSQHADLNHPEEVTYIADLQVANSFKQNIAKAYRYFALVHNIPYDPTQVQTSSGPCPPLRRAPL